MSDEDENITRTKNTKREQKKDRQNVYMRKLLSLASMLLCVCFFEHFQVDFDYTFFSFRKTSSGIQMNQLDTTAGIDSLVKHTADMVELTLTPSKDKNSIPFDPLLGQSVICLLS